MVKEIFSCRCDLDNTRCKVTPDWLGSCKDPFCGRPKENISEAEHLKYIIKTSNFCSYAKIDNKNKV